MENGRVPYALVILMCYQQVPEVLSHFRGLFGDITRLCSRQNDLYHLVPCEGRCWGDVGGFDALEINNIAEYFNKITSQGRSREDVLSSTVVLLG